ncbi:CDK5 regulatory subunit-associated protein 2-like [Rhinatrema bivittatum]|uniref:CDK5 regulatory subunit-associated protein 2-like n=1 Tax=Rhinatrema bivittatum TaxID=194408 RepID=UPI00112864CF|nr:CDK5 regulatory subunit-associated protein 2-like [Rhinatrema bivittatum]
MQNKQLQEKLDLAESVIENLKDKLYMAESMIENLKDRSNTNRELLTGFGVDKQEPDGHNSENVLDDPEELKQRVKDMEIQLEKYQHLFSLLQTDNRVIPSDDSFNSVLINLKIPVGEDVLKTNLKENIDDQGQETSLYSSNATEVKRVKFLKQQRMQLKSELQKEKAISIKLLDHENSLQRKLKIMTPSSITAVKQSLAVICFLFIIEAPPAEQLTASATDMIF